MAYATFNRSTFPLITITFTGESATDETFEAYLDGLYLNYERKEPLGLLFDASNAGFPSIKYQSQQGKWMKDNDALVKAYCVGIAYIVPQRVIRGALKMIFKIYNNPVPFKVFETVEEGSAWIGSKFRS